MDNKTIDEFIARHIVKLPNVGWYKLQSSWGIQNVKCKRNDCTRDYPEWKAELFYHNGNVNNLSRVPEYHKSYTNKTRLFMGFALGIIVKVIIVAGIAIGVYYGTLRLH